jgi:heme iron utilization protein
MIDMTKEMAVRPDTPKQQAMRDAGHLLMAGGTAALSVLDGEAGGPFTTLVNVAADEALRPLLLISSLAHHSKCLAQDNRASLLLHATIADAQDPMLTFRVTLLGRFEKINASECQARFLQRHPYAELYAGFGDFSFWRMNAEHAHIIAGFGRAYGVRFQDVAEISAG